MKYEVMLYHNFNQVSDNHLASFSLTFYFDDNALTIRNVKLMVNKQGHQFISWPAYKNKEEKYIKYIWMTRALKDEVVGSVLNEMSKVEDHSILKEEKPWEELENE